MKLTVGRAFGDDSWTSLVGHRSGSCAVKQAVVSQLPGASRAVARHKRPTRVCAAPMDALQDILRL